MIQMNRKITLLSLLADFVLITTSFSVVGNTPNEETYDDTSLSQTMMSLEDFDVSATFSAEMPTAIAVSDANPFFALVATPLCVRYTPEGNQTIIPLYVKERLLLCFEVFCQFIV